MSSRAHFEHESFLNGLTPASFVYFRSFQTQIVQKNPLDVSGIRTRIVRVEVEHADILTTTTAQHESYLLIDLLV